MKARYSYPLLFLLPSAMVAVLAAFVVVAVGAGVLWLFVYGDNQWPESARTGLICCTNGRWATWATRRGRKLATEDWSKERNREDTLRAVHFPAQDRVITKHLHSCPTQVLKRLLSARCLARWQPAAHLACIFIGARVARSPHEPQNPPRASGNPV